MRASSFAIALSLAACNSMETPTRTGDTTPPAPSTASSVSANAQAPAAPKHYGAAFSLDKSEPLTAAVSRVGAPKGGVGKGDGAHACGEGHGAPLAGTATAGTATAGTAKAGNGKATEGELASCAGAVADDSGAKVRVSGTVSAVCQKAGCWLTLVDGDQEARIFTKEHGFFLPKDIAGRKAEVEGTLRAKVLTEGFAKHLAEDGGKDPSKVTGPLTEYMMTATAVALD